MYINILTLRKSASINLPFTAGQTKKIKLINKILEHIKHEPTQHHLKHKACSQKAGNVANIRTSRQGAKNLQFLSGCNF